MSYMRICEYKGKTYIFHKFFERKQIIPPSNMIGGHSGGTISDVFAILEDYDGNIIEAYPTDLKFSDTNKMINTLTNKRKISSPTKSIDYVNEYSNGCCDEL